MQRIISAQASSRNEQSGPYRGSCMEIAVMGAGIAGLMTAITLHRQGHNCRVFERSRQAQDAGMGFIVLPEGIRSLERFGLQLTGELTHTPLTRPLSPNATGMLL